MHRGARREPIFLDNEHYQLYLDLVESVILKYEVEIHGYSLMPNHYHLLLRSRHGNLSDAMRFLERSVYAAKSTSFTIGMGRCSEGVLRTSSFGMKHGCPTFLQSSFNSRFIEPEKLFEMISQVTGMGREDITMSVMGPRANPARRVTVWALREHTLLRHKEIAALIKMDHSQVSNMLSRFKVGDDSTMTKWMKALRFLYSCIPLIF